MPETESGALGRGREAFERRAWGRAFDELRSSDANMSLRPKDLELLGEAARWSRHFDEMLDTFERAATAYESAGDRRSAARVAVKLTIEHHARHGDALAAGWVARAGRLLEGEPACRERGLVLMCMAQGMFLGGNGPAALQISQEMVELGRGLDDRDIEALGRLALGHARLLGGEVKEGTALIDEAMASRAGRRARTLDDRTDLLLDDLRMPESGRLGPGRRVERRVAALVRAAVAERVPRALPVPPGGGDALPRRTQSR